MTSTVNEEHNNYSLWSDSETDLDLLGFAHLVGAVENLVTTNYLLPATIGVFGDWGCGKTSVLKMAANRLAKHDDSLIVWFNGWLLEDYDQAKASLMECLVRELTNNRTTTAKVKKLAVKLYQRINWLRAASTALKIGGATAAGGLPLGAIATASDLSTYAKSAGEFLNNINDEDLVDRFTNDQEQAFNNNVISFREDFKALLNETNIKKLVVIIDDLDRCLPHTIIQTLEAIKLFLSVGNVAFIIGADERLVQYAVRERFPELPGDRADVGRDYLEKLIQYPVRIPSLSPSEVQSYISLLFVSAEGDEKLIKKSLEWLNTPERSISGAPFGLDVLAELDLEISDKLKEGIILSSQIGPLLGRGLNGNPRQCKRFLNMLMMRLGMAEERGINLKRRLLAKLMILEYLKPDFFKQLFEMQAEGHGIPKQLLAWQSQESIEDESDSAKSENSNPEKVGKDEDLRKNLWLNDNVVKEWLNTEPMLDDTDLRPYFYFSRDNLLEQSIQIQRMSAAARNAYQKIRSQSEAIKNDGLKAFSEISFADASTIIHELFNRAREEEDSSSLSLLLDLCSYRTDIIPEVIAFLEVRPHSQISYILPPKLHQITRETEYIGTARALLDKWSKGSNKPLAKAAKVELERMERKGG